MPTIDKFSGKKITIPEDRVYFPAQGLWAKRNSSSVRFGLTEPFLLM
jgi:hypothetical protein